MGLRVLGERRSEDYSIPPVVDFPNQPEDQPRMDWVIETLTEEFRCVLRASKNPDAGFVVWDVCPPVNVSFQAHKFSLLDAIATGLALAGTECEGEWIMLGRGLFAILRTLPQFVPWQTRTEQGLTYVGECNGARVYLNNSIEAYRFVTGHHGIAVGGRAINAPVTFSDCVDDHAT